jgi:hypothetical protein
MKDRTKKCQRTFGTFASSDTQADSFSLQKSQIFADAQYELE